MQTALRFSGRSRASIATSTLGLVVVAAVVLGMLAVVHSTLAVGFLLAIAIGIACLRYPSALLIVLITSVFLEVVTLGGVTVSRLVAPLATVLIIVAVGRGDARPRWGPPAAWATAYALWAAASMIWTQDSSGTVYLLASLAIGLVYTLVFATLVSTERDLEVVLAVVAVASIAVGLFAIASFAGLAGSNTLQAGRASGAAGDANFFAAYQLVALPLMLSLASVVRRAETRAALYAGILVNVASVLTTLSRGGLIALASVVLMAIVIPSRTMFRSRGQKAMAILVILIAAGFVFKGLSGQFAPRINSMFSANSSGGSGREILWRAGWTSTKQRPLVGLGFGAYRSHANQLILETPNVSLSHYDLRPGGEEPHNAYLGSLAELGIPGLVLFLGVLVSTWFQLRRVSARARALGSDFVARTAGALMVGLVGWAVASIFLSSETSRPLWIIVGLSLALPKLIEVPPSRRANGLLSP